MDNKKQVLLFSALGLLVGVGLCLALGWLFLGSIKNYLSATIDNLSGKQVIFSGVKNVVVQQDDKIAETISSSRQSLAGIFKKNNKDFYQLDDSLQSAVVLTSDGWLLANTSLDKDFANYVAVVGDRQILKIDRQIIDHYSGLVFLHLASAKDLRVAGFVDVSQLKIGQTIVALDWRSVNQPAIITMLGETGIKNSDQPLKQITTSPPDIKATVLVDLGGQIIAVKDKNNNFWQSDYFNVQMNKVLNNQELTRPSLGVNYLNLTDVAMGKNNLGLLLIKNGTKPAVVKNSPADLAGLKDGDIILEINNSSLEKTTDLTNLIFNLKPNSTMKIVYQRADKKIETTATIGELK